jgi:hypothetical protein
MRAECDELRRLLDEPPMEVYGVNREVFGERLAALPGVDVCIVAGLRGAAAADDWDSFGRYLWAAYLRPSWEMTPVLVDVLRRRDETAPNEGIVDLLIDVADPAAFDALREMLWWNPEWDEAHAIAVKAAYALAELPGAGPVLREAAERGPDEVRDAATTILASQPD